MNSRYMIYCCPGTGGLFLTTVFAQVLGTDIRSRFSTTGHAHDMGQGNWRGAPGVCLLGDHWDIHYRPGQQLYYTHYLPTNYMDQNPQIDLVRIDTDPEDYRKVTELYVNKVWPDLWTPEQYKKWYSPAYPPYSADNVQSSELIRNDLILDFEQSLVRAWHQQASQHQPQHCINFRTVMGVGQEDLASVVGEILRRSVSAETQQYIKQYQQINQELYFAR